MLFIAVAVSLFAKVTAPVTIGLISIFPATLDMPCVYMSPAHLLSYSVLSSHMLVGAIYFKEWVNKSKPKQEHVIK